MLCHMKADSLILVLWILCAIAMAVVYGMR